MKGLKYYSYLPLFLQNLLISFYGLYWKRRRFGGIFKSELIGFRHREKYTEDEIITYQRELDIRFIPSFPSGYPIQFYEISIEYIESNTMPGWHKDMSINVQDEITTLQNGLSNYILRNSTNEIIISPRETYSIRLRSYNNLGYSEYSPIFPNITTPDIPSQPHIVSLEPYSTDPYSPHKIKLWFT
jgi:hypothetical protein